MFNDNGSNTLHDVVIPLGNKSHRNKNNEIRIAVTSILKYCTSWIGRIIVVGAEPPEDIIGKVIHVHADDIYKHCKDSNIIHKVVTAINEISDLTDDFIMWSDDQFVTKETKWEDCEPRYMRIYDKKSMGFFRMMASKRIWWKRAMDTLDNFVSIDYTPKLFNPHIPSVLNKHKFIEMCKKYDYTTREDITIFQLYFNFIQEKGKPNFDEFHCQKGETDWKGCRWVGYFDSSMENINWREYVANFFDIKLK